MMFHLSHVIFEENDNDTLPFSKNILVIFHKKIPKTLRILEEFHNLQHQFLLQTGFALSSIYAPTANKIIQNHEVCCLGCT